MKMVVKLFVSLLFTVLLWPATGLANGAKVEAMQMPAWVERAGSKQPLKPGMELTSGDLLTTGEGARLLLRLQEGSLIKMGEQASLDLTAMLPPDNEQGLFEAAINVIKGAFRFTTTALGQTRQRNIDIRIGNVSAGIRGTDIWGSAKSDKDILCLIEGKISAQRVGESAFTMQDPLSFYIAPKDKPALPVATVPAEQLAKWATETELADGEGVLTVDGQWAVNLMSLDTSAATDPVIKTLADAGYIAEVHSFTWHNREWYRIRTTSFQTIKDARAFAGKMDGKYGIVKPWVVHQ